MLKANTEIYVHNRLIINQQILYTCIKTFIYCEHVLALFILISDIKHWKQELISTPTTYLSYI